MRFFDSRLGTLFQEYLLLCLSAPLQSVTALASLLRILRFIGRRLPWGSRVLSAKSAQAIVMLVYLASTIRSQGFSPSQRVHPAWASQLCFTPHPPIGSQVFRAFPAQPASTPFSVSYSLAVDRASRLRNRQHLALLQETLTDNLSKDQISASES